MNKDTLGSLVRDRDRLHNTPRQLEVTERARERKLICLSCRRSPSPAEYRARWLAANPLPRRYCPAQCGWRLSKLSTRNRAEHKRWHLENYVRANMPSFDTVMLTFSCPDCGGQLIEVVI